MFPFGLPVSVDGGMGAGIPVMMGPGGPMLLGGGPAMLPVVGPDGAVGFLPVAQGGLPPMMMDDDEPMMFIQNNGPSSSSFGRPSRRDRLRRGETLTLYHQTDRRSADAIVASQEFRRGSSGAAGGGIYFATSVSDTHRKAHKHGVVLAADVRVGNVKTWSTPGHDFTFSELDREGYDSVRLTCFSSGDEIVVYNRDQVSNIRKVRS